MNRKVVLMILTAIVLAGGAALMANKWLHAQMLSGQDMRAGMIPVPAAAVQIAFGQKIELSHIKLIELPEKSLPAGVFKDQNEVIGKIAAQPIYPGEMLLQGRIVEHLGGSTLAAVIEPGMRAVSVAVNEVVGVSGFLLPGNRVDILATRRTGNQRFDARTLLQDVKVLAVDQTSSTAKNDPIIVRSVTLEVSPKEAELLTKATQEGKVQLTLRNPVDEKVNPVTEEKKPVVRKVVRAPVVHQPKVTVIRGTSVSSSTVNK